MLYYKQGVRISLKNWPSPSDRILVLFSVLKAVGTFLPGSWLIDFSKHGRWLRRRPRSFFHERSVVQIKYVYLLLYWSSYLWIIWDSFFQFIKTLNFAVWLIPLLSTDKNGKYHRVDWGCTRRRTGYQLGAKFSDCNMLPPHLRHMYVNLKDMG